MNQEERRQQLYDLLGELPERNRPVSASLINREEKTDYILETLLLDLNGIEPVPAYLVKPLGGQGRLPIVLYNHAHGGTYELGKDELLEGRKVLLTPHYATELTRAGYAALCIDTWAFGQRRGRTESEIFKHMVWHGQFMWGMMVYDSIKAIDYLATRDDLDISRLATLGISMGSTMAWWVAALDERVKVTVDICGLTEFQALIQNQMLDGHGIYYYIPSLLKHFTTGQINALIAPRAHLSLAGNYDRLTPASGLDKVDAELKAAYRQANATAAWEMGRYEIGHFETADMRKRAMAFLAKWI